MDALLHLEYIDGTNEMVVTDASRQGQIGLAAQIQKDIFWICVVSLFAIERIAKEVNLCRYTISS